MGGSTGDYAARVGHWAIHEDRHFVEDNGTDRHVDDCLLDDSRANHAGAGRCQRTYLG